MSLFVQSDSAQRHRLPLRVYSRQTNVKAFVTLAVVGAVLLCIGVLVLAVGLVYGSGLLSQCDNGDSGCPTNWWLLASAAPGAILAGIGLLILTAAVVRGLRRD